VYLWNVLDPMRKFAEFGSVLDGIKM